MVGLAYSSEPDQHFDLIGRNFSVADQHPELVAKLQKRIVDFDADLKANVRPAGE
ncbi:MAG: hypothetical protein ACI9R3_001385 [Verrucomicrobiales bacterium]|jgi:hypothetical protein